MNAGPGADVAVRVATAGDVSAVARVQGAAWSALPPAVTRAWTPPGHDVSAVIEDASEAMARAWSDAVVATPSPRHRVLVATAAGLVVGFAAVAPAGDPDTDPGDAELVVLEVDPAHRGAGHGSRLVNAAADTARESGFARLLHWCPDTDGPRLVFLERSGMSPDGATRTRDVQLPRTDGTSLSESRLAAWLPGGDEPATP